MIKNINSHFTSTHHYNSSCEWYNMTIKMNLCLIIHQPVLRMVKRVTGLQELDKWIVNLSEDTEEGVLDNLDEFIDESYEE